MNPGWGIGKGGPEEAGNSKERVSHHRELPTSPIVGAAQEAR